MNQYSDETFGLTSEHSCYLFRVRCEPEIEVNETLKGFVLYFPEPRFYAASYEHETSNWFATIPLTKQEFEDVRKNHLFVEMVGGKFKIIPLWRIEDSIGKEDEQPTELSD